MITMMSRLSTRGTASAALALALLASSGCKGKEVSRRDSMMSMAPASAPKNQPFGGLKDRPFGALEDADRTFVDVTVDASSGLAKAGIKVIQPWKTGATSMTESVPEPGTPVYLDVALQHQERSSWCWAAVGSMVLNFMGRPATQCEEANERFRTDPEFPHDCCPPSRCDWPGYPVFPGISFASREGNALSWDELTEQLRHGIPVAFSWKWTGGGEHMLVAIGYITGMDNRRWVYVHDPSNQFRQPPFILYERFVRSASYDHGRDYFISEPGS